VKKLVVIALVCVFAWSWYQKRNGMPVEQVNDSSQFVNSGGTQSSKSVDSFAARQTYSCDGRKHCSQMTSCAEATYFLRNCPGTEMDGDNDGEPCESQWCSR
jgi:hypothetical protein